MYFRTVSLKALGVGRTDNLPVGVDFKLFIPLVNVIQDSHFSQPWA